MEPLLKQKTVELRGQKITLRELSAHDNIEYLAYVNGFESPAELPENASAAEHQGAVLAWRKISLMGHSRLVAYGVQHDHPGMSLDELQSQVQKCFTADDLKYLHDQMADLCGFQLLQSDTDEAAELSDDADSESSQSTSSKN